MDNAFSVKSREQLSQFVEQLRTELPPDLSADEFLARLVESVRAVPWVTSYATAMLARDGGWAILADALARAVDPEHRPA
ncbi:MAG TPA: hypothetical protein VGE74_19645 [Gemmata sp.]